MLSFLSEVSSQLETPAIFFCEWLLPRYGMQMAGTTHFWLQRALIISDICSASGASLG